MHGRFVSLPPNKVTVKIRKRNTAVKADGF